MKKVVVFFRADGNNQIGLGHLVRCIALAEMLKHDFEISFVCKSIPSKIVSEISELQFNLIRIDEEAEFLKLLKPGHIVVLDNYDLDTSYQQKVKQTGSKLVCIDDLNDKAFFADLIINHAPNIHGDEYDAQIYTQYALGLPYVLLRPVFLEAAKRPKFSQTIKTVFVCFGGADNRNLTQEVVDVLKKDSRFEQILIVTGAAFAYMDELKQLIDDDTRCILSHAISSEQMCNLMQQAQLAIVPASGILQEAIAVGCRIISGIYVDNQQRIFEKYHALGAFVSAVNFSRLDIIHAIDKSFADQDLSVKAYIDGYSGVRLLNSFNQLVKQDGLTLRRAEESDAETTFKWATDRKIRAFSFSDSEIEYQEHLNWFAQKVRSSECYYFIASMNDSVIGSIRFDIKDEVALISYLLDSGYHNQGLGILLLKKGLEKLVSVASHIKKVVGYVMPQNVPSIKAFQRLGYRELQEDGNFKFEKNIVL